MWAPQAADIRSTARCFDSTCRHDLAVLGAWDRVLPNLEDTTIQLLDLQEAQEDLTLGSNRLCRRSGVWVLNHF